MTQNMEYKDYNDFLAKHYNNKNNSSSYTHTRIGDKSLNIYGGSYVIANEELPTFYKLYYDNVFIKKKLEYLTEKQVLENGPLLIDLDFRYNYDIDQKQHTQDHIIDLLTVILDELKDFFLFEPKSFPIFVMEKPEVNRLTDCSLTKDGIHIIIGIQMNHIMQVMLRERMIIKIPEIWGNDLPLTNDIESVLDEGISRGTTNWQLYGSRKPGNQAYELTQYFEIKYDCSDGEFMMEKKEFKVSAENICYLSAQYTEHICFDINPKIKAIYEKNINNNKKTKSKPKPSITTTTTTCGSGTSNEDDEDENNPVGINDITNRELLEKAVDYMLKNLKTNDHFIREIHEYTQILPEKYYEPGSHNLNTQVAFALKHTDERLFISWVMLRSKASDFDYSSIPDLYNRWKKQNIKQDGITKKSIIYWAKQDAYDQYVKIRKNTIDYYLDITINNGQTEYDFAVVLYQIFKDKYVCSSIKNTEWYIFKDHRWERDYGISLRLAISKEMHQIYYEKTQTIQNQLQHISQNDETDEVKIEKLKKNLTVLYTIMNKLKKTSDKNNIMREASEIFYDKDFIKYMDANKYLMCFTNGVVDFKNGIFRNGYPQDYITKTTGIPYIENIVSLEDKNIEKDIIAFMKQLFPESSLNKYMWDHLASVLIGENINQTFNIYLGSGSNGKSILIDLMAKTLGEYKGIVPISLISDKRTSLGGTCSELMLLKGIRFAVMQEPSKNTKINEGVMKELTGGDPIQARQLYSESETYIPQFSLVVCTNCVLDFESNDDGTWRRVRLIPFMSKFLDEDHIDWNNPDVLYKYAKDKSLKDKLSIYAPVFASMLVKIAFKTKGIVEDCEIVLSSSNKYRQSQDIITGFINEMVENKPGMKITYDCLFQEFKKWNDGQLKKLPKRQELYDAMDKKYGKSKNKCWKDVSIIVPEDGDYLDEDCY